MLRMLIPLLVAGLTRGQDATDDSLRSSDYGLLPADDGNVLVPPYWDLAQKASTVLTASSTCGSDPVPDRFCDIYFDDCDFCNGQDTNSSKRHPIENVIDNTENFWMSPPLSKNTFDKDYSEVNITIDLQQPFHVAYVTIKYAMSPRAKTWVLEKSLDGVNWEPWQYFARTQNACQDKFGVFTSVRLTDSTPICTQEYTDFVPAKNGEVIVSLINDRPSMIDPSESFASSKELQEFVRARYVRIRLLEVNTLLSHLMSPQPDATAKQRYFYSIKKIEVGGRCVCNGHANRCHQSLGEFKCDCQHNTEGTNCERCKPNYVQKKWKPGMPDNDNVCEECNCHGHATVCKYVEEVDLKRGSMDIYGNYVGGGVCQNCQGNTFGNNCEQCKPGFWRSPDQPKTDACQPCECTPEHSLNGGICDTRTGQCTCETNFGGRQCNQCQKGKYYYPHCDRDIPPGFPDPDLVNNCGTCSTDLMDAVLPQTDTIKKTVVSLNHVKANKLTMTKFQYLSNMSQPIEHDRQNIEAGMNLLMNYDERMDEVENKICGPNGLAEKHDAMVGATDAQFQALREAAEQVQYDTDKEFSRAESFVGDFEMLAKMSDADYEEKMEEARDTVDHLEQIVINNPYEPLKDKAQEEFDRAAALLENVKERFGGTQRTGRCNTARAPVDYSVHRYDPANSENFDFTPGDIKTIDIDGQPISQETYYHPDYSPPEHVDNSHIFEPEEGDRTQVDPTEEEPDYRDYDEYTEPDNYYEPSYDDTYYSDPQTNEYEPEMDDFEQPFTLSTDMHTIGPEDGACVDQGRLSAIIPSHEQRKKAEQMLLDTHSVNTNVREAYIGLHADVRVPPEAWRWEAKQWRHFKFRAPWALDNVHDGNKRCAVISPDGWRTENCETRLNQYICLGRAISGRGRGLFRYFMKTSNTPLTYLQAAKECANAGLLIAVIPSTKTNEIIFKAAEDQAKGDTYKAWIGLRAEGDETEVEWAWANGRPLGAETFRSEEVMVFNEQAARKNKRCIVARVEEYSTQVFWVAESCDVQRYHMCSLNPADNAYEDSLSRAKRNNNVIMVSQRGARPDGLEKLNDAQDSNEFNPKYSQFDELDNLVMTSSEEEYPATSSLVDQLECVESIEGKSVEMSSKLNDLDHKIAHTKTTTDELDNKLNQMEADIEEMNNDIDEINNVEQLIQDALSFNDESARLAAQATEDMDDLEEYEVADFQIEAVKVRTAEYGEHNYEQITGDVNLARTKAVAFKKKYGELCSDFPIACNSCEMADSGEIECDLDRFVDLKRLIADIATNADEATNLLDQAKKLYLELQSFASGGKSDCSGPGEAKRAQDVTSLQNVYDNLKKDLEDLINNDIAAFPELNNFDFSHIESLYGDIREMLYGNSTDEQIAAIGDDATIWNDIHGLEGATNFAANPGCWREGVECTFNTDMSNTGNQEAMEQNDLWMRKYNDLMEQAITGAKEDMDQGMDGGISNNIDGIGITIKKLESEIDAAEGDKEELERTVNDIQHLIASARSLLDRIPQARNGQNMDKAAWFEPQLPEDAGTFGKSVYSFELTVNARARKKANNILFVGEEANSLAIDTDDDGHVLANFNTGDTGYRVRSEDPLPIESKAWHQITFTKNGRRIAVSHECVANCDESDIASQDRGDVRRRKRKRRNRHSKRHLNRSRRQAGDECNGDTSHCFLPYVHTAWPIDFYKIETSQFYMFVGAYYAPLQEVYSRTGVDITSNFYDGNDEGGFDGDINGIEINRHLITPFHFKTKHTTAAQAAALKVPDPMPEAARCFDNRRNKFTESSTGKECPCLDGQDSYIMYTSEELDIVFRDELRGHLEFTYSSLADKYVMGAIFSEDGENYMIILKANDQYKLHIRGKENNEWKMYNSTCTAYSPDQSNLINLRFGIMKQYNDDSHNPKPKQAGILQWLTDYRPTKEQLHDQHLIEIPDVFWQQFWRTIKERNFYLGGIPSHYLKSQIRTLLTDYGIIETFENDRVSIASMPACIKKLNINHDHKNDERTMEAIDAKGIYRNNEIPIRHDILYQPGQRRGTDERGNKVIERDFGDFLLEDAGRPELSFGLKLIKLDGEINVINFDNTGSLMIRNKRLTLTVGDESQSFDSAIDHQSFYALIIASDAAGTTFTVVDGKTVVGTLSFSGSLSLAKFAIGADDNSADFEAVIADMRYQSSSNNYDVMNGKARARNAVHASTDIDTKTWYVCSGWKCSGIQYNTMYSFN